MSKLAGAYISHEIYRLNNIVFCNMTLCYVGQKLIIITSK